MRMDNFAASALLTCCFLIPLHITAAEESALASQLRVGGLVIFLQPPAMTGTQTAPAPAPPECEAGGGLSPQEWVTARNLGVGFRKQQIRFETAHTSFVCAARHTAYLLVGADKVHHHPNLALQCPHSNTSSATPLLHQLMSQSFLYPGMNRLVVGKSCALDPFAHSSWPTCARHLEAGDAVVLRAVPEKGMELLGCLPGSQLLSWSTLQEF